jgi:hypothetical protein
MREIDGRFGPGNRYGQHNEGNRRVAELRRVMHSCATPEKIVEMEGALFAAGVAGDVAAMKIWLEFMIGKPDVKVAVSGGDDGAFNLQQVIAVIQEVVPERETQFKIAAAFHKLGAPEPSAETPEV